MEHSAQVILVSNVLRMNDSNTVTNWLKFRCSYFRWFLQILSERIRWGLGSETSNQRNLSQISTILSKRYPWSVLRQSWKGGLLKCKLGFFFFFWSAKFNSFWNKFQAVQTKGNTTDVFFMSYHTTVTKSYDFYTSLEEARKLADQIQGEMLKHDESAVFFPYR